MKKLNIQVYQGDPSGLVTKDNNNLFIEGDVQYSTGAGTIVKSVTSIKNSNGEEIMSGGGGGDLDPDVVEYLEEHPEIGFNETCGLITSYDIDSTMDTGALGIYFAMSSDTITDGVYLGSAYTPIEDYPATAFYSYTFKPGSICLCKSADERTNKYNITFTEDVTINDFDSLHGGGTPILVPSSKFTYDEIIG